MAVAHHTNSTFGSHMNGKRVGLKQHKGVKNE